MCWPPLKAKCLIKGEFGGERMVSIRNITVLAENRVSVVDKVVDKKRAPEASLKPIWKHSVV